MLDLIFEIYYTCFNCYYNVLNRVELGHGITLWKWIIVCFMAFGVAGMLLRSFDIGSIGEGTDSTIKAVNSYRANKAKSKTKSKGG